MSERGNYRDLSLRPIRDSDDAFLHELYGTTRAEEMELAGLDAVQRATFIDMQFRAQYADYRHRFPDASFDVVQCDDEAVGRLYVARSESELRILDVTITPPQRGRGIGRQLIEQLINEGRRVKLPVRICLDNGSRSIRLFRRLGFTCASEEETYSLFEWLPPDP